MGGRGSRRAGPGGSLARADENGGKPRGCGGCRRPKLSPHRHLSRWRERSRSKPRERARRKREADFQGNSSEARPLSPGPDSPTSPRGRGAPGNRTAAETRDISISPAAPSPARRPSVGFRNRLTTAPLRPVPPIDPRQRGERQLQGLGPGPAVALSLNSLIQLFGQGQTWQGEPHPLGLLQGDPHVLQEVLDEEAGGRSCSG